MSRAPRPCTAPDRRFGWRDAFALLKGMARAGLTHDPRVSYRSLARVSALDPVALPPAHSFTTSDGARLSYRTYGGQGDCHIVLIHGSACFGDQLHRLAVHLAQGGIATAHTLDMRGHGRSAGPPPGYDTYAADIGAFAHHLANAGHRTIVLAGHSAGGGLVLNTLASGHAPALSGCILLAPFLGFGSPTLRPHFGDWLEHIDVARLARVAIANLAGNDSLNGRPLIRFNTEAYLHDPRFVREWSFDAVFGFGPGPAACRRPIADIPVLLVAGDRDECFRQERYAAEMRRIAPRGRTVILPGLGHWDILADRLAFEACDAWLAENFDRQTINASDRTMEEKRVQFG